MSEKRSLKVSILGKSFSIVTDESDEIINKAAHTIDILMQQLANSSLSRESDEKKMIFVTLQLALDVVKKQKEVETMSDKADTLSSLLQEALSENIHTTVSS